ncbi:hypothetical protein PG993_006702 [Apiospora rasikravindrae]|uniref:Heterokaryon incompatibility domain-containing protein n=1 Tax=Apiospora rasikravindrae TaxID=990691 RepID=A0ABR1T6E9_9PEZI
MANSMIVRDGVQSFQGYRPASNGDISGPICNRCLTIVCAIHAINRRLDDGAIDLQFLPHAGHHQPPQFSAGSVAQAPLQFFPLTLRAAEMTFEGFGDVVGFAEPYADSQGSPYSTPYSPVGMLSRSGKKDTLIRPRRVKPMVDYSIAKGWLAHCRDGHQVCSLRRPGAALGFQLRVIDCVTRQVVCAPSHCQYVALSYVWGETEQTHRGGNPISPVRFPMVVEDSITVVRELGYRFLWVDRHCIDQNDAAGKHATISSMHVVYGNSQLTIIAAAGTDAEYGLPGVGTRAREEQGCVTVGKYSFVNMFLDARTALKHSKWGTRGWTYQEGLLPTRRLIFTDQQVYFQCNTAHYMESVSWPDYLLNSETSLTPVADWPRPAFQLIGAQSNADEKAQLLIRLVRNYSRRNLSYEADTMQAFLGILGMFSAADPPVYHVWGTPVTSGPCRNRTTPSMWLTCWYHETPSERRAGFPSWSWGGWTGTIESTRLRDAGILESSYCRRIEVRDADDDAGTAITLDRFCVDEHQHAYARYATGSHLLRLRVARMTEVTLRYIASESAAYVRRPAGSGVHVLHRLRDDDVSLRRDALLYGCGKTLPAFQANDFCIVVLRPCSGGGDHHYQRVGVFFALDDYILEQPDGSLSCAVYGNGDDYRRYYGNFRGECGFGFYTQDIALV